MTTMQDVRLLTPPAPGSRAASLVGKKFKVQRSFGWSDILAGERPQADQEIFVDAIDAGQGEGPVTVLVSWGWERPEGESLSFAEFLLRHLEERCARVRRPSFWESVAENVVGRKAVAS